MNIIYKLTRIGGDRGRFIISRSGAIFCLVMFTVMVLSASSADAGSDGDGIPDHLDSCPAGETGWTSSPATDYDGDGCRDATEDPDDDNDGVADTSDSCPGTPVGIPVDSSGCALSTSVPTVSEWGLISMAVLLMIVGIFVIRRRHQH